MQRIQYKERFVVCTLNSVNLSVNFVSSELISITR